MFVLPLHTIACGSSFTAASPRPAALRLLNVAEDNQRLLRARPSPPPRSPHLSEVSPPPRPLGQARAVAAAGRTAAAHFVLHKSPHGEDGRRSRSRAHVVLHAVAGHTTTANEYRLSAWAEQLFATHRQDSDSAVILCPPSCELCMIPSAVSGSPFRSPDSGFSSSIICLHISLIEAASMVFRFFRRGVVGVDRARESAFRELPQQPFACRKGIHLGQRRARRRKSEAHTHLTQRPSS